MLKLLIGLALWWAAHFLKRVAPGVRGKMVAAVGEKPVKAVVGIVLIGAVVLLVKGFEQVTYTPVYTPIPGIGYLNNALMLVAIFVFGIGMAHGRLSVRVRHPMLLGVILWAFAHLLVNGDLASIVLFGGLGVWAVLQIWLINRAEGAWVRPTPGKPLRDRILFLVTLLVFVAIAEIHRLYGYNPFLGTYK